MSPSSVATLKRQSQPDATRIAPLEDADQHELPLSREANSVEVPAELVRAKKNKGAAFTLACDASGLDDKEISMPLGIDAAVFSRIKSGSVSLNDDLIAPFCKKVKNRIYPEWIAYQVGCQLQEIETETQRQNRLMREQITKQEAELQLLRGLITGKAA